MRPTTILISIIVFGMIILGSSLFLGNLASEYGVPANTNFTSLQKINETIQISNEMTNQFQKEEKVSTQEESFLSLSYGYVWNAAKSLKMIFSTGKIFSAMVDDLTTFTHMPTWFSTGLLAIIAIILFSAIVGAITRWFI